jgi:hypothetical protein
MMPIEHFVSNLNIYIVSQNLKNNNSDETISE